MKKIIIGLAGLNLVLAGFLALALTRPNPGRALEPAATPSPGDVSTIDHRRSNAQNAPVANLPAAPVQFRWASLVSRDMRVFAANLREVGCPEETIKEIILAEVGRRYSPMEAELKVRPDDVAPWEKAALYDRRNAESKLRQLLEEKRALIKELTGVDTGIDMPSRLAGRDVAPFEGAFAALAEDKRAQVRAIQENYWTQSDDIKQRTMGYLEPEDRAEFERIKKERRDALAKVLTPEELLDFELKTSNVSTALRQKFDGFDTTQEEFKKIFEFMQPLDDQFSVSRRNPDPVDPEFTAARGQAEKDLEQHIRNVLGEDRYAEFERTRDPAYRNLKQIGAELELPQESILQAYQAQRQFQEESKKIMQDPNLSQEQRMQSFEGLRIQAEQQAQQIFGDKAPQIMQRIQGGNMAQRFGIQVEKAPVHPVPNPQGENFILDAP
jgi:hypothetical protein